MARLTLILGVLATVIYLLDGFRFALNEWRRWRHKGTWVSVMLLCLVPMAAWAEDLYVGQADAGVADGSNCANQHSVTWFNTAGNWGVGAGKISAGDTAHLCGTITTNQLIVQDSGTAGNVITILFETGAEIAPTECSSTGCMKVSSRSYIVIDGGTPCGWIQYANVTCNGKLYATTVQPLTSQAGITIEGCSFCEVRNLQVGPLYQIEAYVPGAGSAAFISSIKLSVGPATNTTLKIHHNVFSDAADVVSYIPAVDDNGLEFYNNYSYRVNKTVVLANSTNGVNLLAANIHDNHFGETANWDRNVPSQCSGLHHSAIHAFTTDVAGTATNSGIHFHHNFVDGLWGDCITSFVFYEGSGDRNHDNYVYTNLFAGSATVVSIGRVAVDGDGANYVLSNTMLCQGPTDVGYGPTGVSTSITFKNNIAHNCTTETSTTVGITITEWDYNIYDGCASACWHRSTPNVWENTLAGWQTYCACDSHSLYDASSSYIAVNSDGTLQASSPARGAGNNLTSLGIAALNTDYRGMGRPASGAWDMGAIQYADSTSSPVVVGRVLRWMEVASIVTLAGKVMWYFKNAIVSGVMLCLTVTSGLSLSAWQSGKQVAKQTSLVTLIAFNSLTKPKN